MSGEIEVRVNGCALRLPERASVSVVPERLKIATSVPVDHEVRENEAP